MARLTHFARLSGLRTALLFCATLLLASLWGLAQDATPAKPAQPTNQPEVSSQDAEPAFRIRAQRNLVLVRVVVRDAQGRPVGNLRREDFRLLDNKNPQVISHFSVDNFAGAPSITHPAPGMPEAAPGSGATPAAPLPLRFLALYFDDIHMKFEEVARTRLAAEHFLDTAEQVGDRVGLFTSSGQGQLDFTGDRNQVTAALGRLTPRPVVGREENSCPEIFDYQAYLIVHEHDQFALRAASQEAYHCLCEITPNPPPSCANDAQAAAEAKATQVLNEFERESDYALRGLERVVEKTARTPGQRSVILVSPGFLTPTQVHFVDEIVEHALRSNVIINSLDAKGLYAPLPLSDDLSHRPLVDAEHPESVGDKVQIQLASIERSADVLRNVALDTGGTYFHNSNDLDQGFRRCALESVHYTLAFTPTELKADGRYHALRVDLLNHPGLTVEARRGYYARTAAADSAAAVDEELENAVFSQEPMDGIPISVQTQFFKVSPQQSKLAVLTRVDVRFMHFRKQEDRNLNRLTLVTALFDEGGHYVAGLKKLVDFHLHNSTLQRLSSEGLSIRTSFNVKSGTYLVREVVQDGEDAQFSAVSRTVEIP